MTYTVIWDDAAFKTAQAYMEDGPGLTAVLDGLDHLVEDPRPRGAMELGQPNRLRIHIGRYRVWYDIDDDSRTVKVTHLGRLA